jgi:hypothetical protein
MLGFCCCANAGALATITRASDASKPVQMPLPTLIVDLLDLTSAENIYDAPVRTWFLQSPLKTQSCSLSHTKPSNPAFNNIMANVLCRF